MEIETDNPLDVNAHCLECPGTGWLLGDSKCFKQNGRPRACFIPEDRGHKNGPIIRPPLSPRPVGPAPAPLARVKVLEPAPVVPLDIADVPAQVRAWWAVGVSPRVIAARLNSWKVPPTRGSKWFRSSVWALLLDAPCEPAPAKRDA